MGGLKAVKLRVAKICERDDVHVQYACEMMCELLDEINLQTLMIGVCLRRMVLGIRSQMGCVFRITHAKITKQTTDQYR